MISAVSRGWDDCGVVPEVGKRGGGEGGGGGAAAWGGADAGGSEGRGGLGLGH